MAKNKKKKKMKLSSLLLLLLLTSTMMITTIYAWFTSNRTVTVSTFDVNVQSQNGLQISADATNWKTVLTNEDIKNGYVGHTNQVPNVMEPTSTAGKVDTSTGFLKMYYGAVGTNNTGDYTLTTTRSTETAGYGSGSNGKFIAFDLFLKVDQPETLYLTSASNVNFKALSNDKGLQNAARVAFLVQGNKLATDPVNDMQTLKGATDLTTYIWEPNNDVHTASSVTHARDTYNIVTQETGANQIAYDGALDESGSTEVKVKEAKSATHPTLFTPVTMKWSTPKVIPAFQNMFQLQAGVTKVRIYMWIEGQDVDCQNNASGSDISYNIQLSVNDQ